MRQYLAILALFSLAACSGEEKTTAGDDDDTAPGDDDDDDDDAGCGNSVAAFFPADGDVDVYYKSDIRFTLAAEDAGASVTVADAGGAEVSGSTMVEGKYVTWSGDDFAPGTDYTATLTYGTCTPATIAFTTSSTGSPTADSPVNHVYDLGLTSGQWILPSPEVGPILAGLLESEGGVELLIMPTSVGATIEMIGALGTGNDEQDICTPSLPFPPADFTDPYFSIESPALPIAVGGFSIVIEDLALSGAFSPNVDRIQGASLAGTVDTRPLVDLISPGGPPETVCDTVGALGVSCVACADGSGDFCISIWVDQIQALEVGADPLVEIDEATAAANCPT